MATIVLSDAMKYGISDMTIKKMEYSDEYIRERNSVTEKIETDHQNYAELLNHCNNIWSD